jgi:hypothetical protein
MARRGVAAMNQKLLLEPEDFVRGDDPMEFSGGEALRRFVGVDLQR